MDKQIVFYNSEYQFYYSPKNKTISSPQESGKKQPNFGKKKLLYYLLIAFYLIMMSGLNPIAAIMAYEMSTAIIEIVLIGISIRAFLKIKVYFDFSPKWLWYIIFLPFSFLGLFVTYFTVASFNGKINYDIMMAGYWILFIGIGILLNSKKRINVPNREEFVDTYENKKMLRDVLMSNDINYKGIIVFEVIVLGLLACFAFSIETFVPVFIVAVFQRNICYLILIHKIAKQYGISLKSKDVIAENDAEAKKQINAQKEIILQGNIEEKLHTDNNINTESKTNADTNLENR